MKGRRCGALAALVLLLGCDPSATRPTPDGGLALEIVFSHDGPVSADAGTVRIRGGTTMNISLAPGAERFIDLDPGSYVISLEALAAGEVVGFAQRSATVREGQVTTVTLTPSDFIPTITQVPATAEVGVPFTLRWSSVSGAVAYRLEASVDPGFSTVQASETIDDTQAEVTADENVWFFRVRAVTEFGAVGHPSAHTTGTDVILATGSAPVITGIGIAYLPVQGCPAGNLDFSTVEYFEYQDEDGDVPGGVLGASDVEAQYRFSDQGDWTSYGSIQWDPVSGDGHSGELVTATCWDAHEGQSHVDVRVRIRDDRGNWSDWAETRLNFPDAIEVLPEGGTSGVSVGSGESLQFTATAMFEGEPLPGDPTVWSSFNSPDLASIDQNGVYTLVSGGEGLDRVFARAVFTYANRAILGPESGAASSWWAPCWRLPSFGLANQGDWQYYRMRVFEGMEYRVEITANTSGTGDPDLYLGFNAMPTLSDHVASGVNAGDDSILWTASADGVLWIGIYAYSAFTDHRFQVTTPDDLCGAPGATQYPPSPTTASGLAPRPGPNALLLEMYRDHLTPEEHHGTGSRDGVGPVEGRSSVPTVRPGVSPVVRDVGGR